jgi:hypothetical protein
MVFSRHKRLTLTVECAIRAEREHDEAMQLIEWIRSMKIVEQMDRIDAFLAARKGGVIQ